MSHLRRARLRYRFTSDHERARQLASERLTETLAPLEAEWLDRHLAVCDECAAIAAAYERDALALRAAREAAPSMPRDLWARTAAALDAEERRLSGPRASGPRRGLAAPRPVALAPYGILAVAIVAAVVVGSTLLSNGAPVAPTITTPLPSAAAVPSPVPIEAANVAWFAPQDDGTYALNVTAVSDVCPAGAEGCAPVDGSSRQQLRLSAAPRAVLRSPAGVQLAVLDAATKSIGGTIYMVRLPAPPAAATTPPTGPSPSPTVIAIASPPPTPSPTSADASSAAMVGPPETAPAASAVEPAPSSSAPSPSPSASATDGSALAIATSIVVVGETMAYSPDGAWFAFTARPADGTTGTDIWVWHVGDALARPVTTDHRSVFASWLGDLVLGSRAEPETTAGTAGGASDGTTVPGPIAPNGTEGTTTPAGTEAVPTPTQTPTQTPSPTPEPTPSPTPSYAGSESPTSSFELSSGTTSLLRSPSGPVARPVSFLLDPASEGRADLVLSGWRPVVDPTGRWVVYWDGRITLDPATLAWVPLDGGFAIAPWAAFAGVASSDGTFILPPLPSLPASTDGTAASDGLVGPALPSEVGGASGTEAEGGSAATPSTVLEPPIASSSVAPSDQSVGAEGSPGSNPSSIGSDLLSPGPTPFAPLLAPESLPGIAVGNGLGALPTDWDVRWDPSGDHLAVWVADPVDPRLGRLSLLALDAPTGRVDLDNSLLRDEPALGGISLDEGRLAWATPPGQDGQGSRLQILGWGDAGSGQLDGQPVNGQETVVVVR